MEKIKVVILCGGKGMRLREETEFKPKPMVEIGERPILWHIMKTYAHYGHTDFVLCLGYRGEHIKNYFLNFELLTSDLRLELGRKDSLKLLDAHPETGWRITLADTGLEAQTGARIKRVQKYVDSPLFMLTYGDGVGNIDVGRLLEFHQSHGKIGTVTGVCPPSRFGELEIKSNQVMAFSEKPLLHSNWINGGYFVFDQRIFNYISGDEQCSFEQEPLKKLAADGELMLYSHDGFWQCMDTYRDMSMLNKLWEANQAPWKVW